ncbi:MAG: acyloxyacyl hydrolase [Rhodomicrobium sp.]
MRHRKPNFRAGLAYFASISAALVLAGFGSTPAAAADLYTPAAAPYAPVAASDTPWIVPFTPADRPFWSIDEVRVGALDHALEDSLDERGAALNLEVLGGRFPGGYGNSILDFFLTPRPNIGTTIAFGKTDEFYWGVTWDAKLYGPLFLETSFGGAAHDGPLDERGASDYGCRLNFRESASLGYAVTSQWRLMVEVDHMSNANLCEPNHGLTNAGIRLGYRF